MCTTSPLSASHTSEVRLLQLMNLPWRILITQRPEFALGFPLVLNSVGFNRFVMTCIHNFDVIQSSFTALKICVLPFQSLHCIHAESLQSCLTLGDSMDLSQPDSSAHGILQARTLERVAIFFSRESSRPRDQSQVSHTAGRFFTLWATREALLIPPSPLNSGTHWSFYCLQ